MDFCLLLNMDQYNGKNISKSLNSKCSKKLLDHAKQSSTDAFKTSLKRVIQKTVEATGDLIGNKIADKITTASKTFPKNSSETNEEETLRGKYILSKFKKNSLMT